MALALLMMWCRRRHHLGEDALGELGCPHPSMRGGALIGDGPRGSVIGVTCRSTRVVAVLGCDVAVDNVGGGSGGWR